MLKSVEKFLKLFIPPVFSHLWRKIRPRRIRGHLIFAPDGSNTQIKASEKGWDSEYIVADMEREIDSFARRCRGAGPLSFTHLSSESKSENPLRLHNLHMTWAYVIALASRNKEAISILDWGGGLGHFYQLARAVLSEDALDYHCKEIPSTVNVGRRINSAVTWYDDEACLVRTFDLILVSGSLQYMENWAGFLGKLAAIADDYLLLLRTPVVDEGDGFYAIQRIGETELLHQLFSEPEILAVMDDFGFSLVREFFDGSRLRIVQAEIECELKGRLFQKKT